MGQSLIFLLIALGSLGGIVFILYRKIPALLVLNQEEMRMRDFVRQGIKKIPVLQKIKPEEILRGTFMKVRTIASQTKIQKTEWLEKLREKTDQRKEGFSESYWDQLRKKTRRKK
ncbi:MAG: hypothetical protein A2940_00305 [Candidatus Wildermuthbacteria bacterium RIFCSPLOWO2_01_FULL_48_29]|uniref:Uncharacterized protein n=2 Tax=Candidatus Wildermuthiibacteriota TaxID=1817923 RepID=A0A1G2RJG4_9BACT|nr:MAG: hypothetical protein A2843_00910 [Candidatus Wildermuthbacteria bacterium RIFCSPHIGHO2_01_FULL_48_27b]OHA72984.1 MAG: hypothetical protein A2940_00305 [Candidatus Wildermuthbacteria bacterium RIFCSPLOWO2_01_FULL_48_29]